MKEADWLSCVCVCVSIRSQQFSNIILLGEKQLETITPIILRTFLCLYVSVVKLSHDWVVKRVFHKRIKPGGIKCLRDSC